MSLSPKEAELYDAVTAYVKNWEAACDEGSDLPFDGEEPEDYTDYERERLEEKREGLTAAESPDELRDEIRQLEKLIQLAGEAERVGQEAKIEQLRGLVATHLKNNHSEKLLVFTEFKDTLFSGEAQRDARAARR